MLTQTDFDPIIATVPSFQTKWLQLKERGELYGPVSVDFSYYIIQHLIEHAGDDDEPDSAAVAEAPSTGALASLGAGYRQTVGRHGRLSKCHRPCLVFETFVAWRKENRMELTVKSDTPFVK
jgi:hypothetical protein